MSVILKTIKFLLPEIQLIDLVRQEGFIARSRRAPEAYREETSYYEGNQQSAPMPTYQTGGGNFVPNASGQAAFAGTSQSSPQQRQQSAAYGETESRTRKLSTRELDDIFEEVAAYLNRRVIGQQSFVADLIAAYKRGYLDDRTDAARQTILLAGAAGTGKKTALGILNEQLHRYKLTLSPRFTEIHLNRYDADEISGNFIADMAAAFQDGTGTVAFTGIKEADPAIASYVASLAAEGSFRTKEGVRVDAAGYIIVFYVDYPAKDGAERGQIPPELASAIPVPVLRGIKAVAITVTLDTAALVRIAEELLEKELRRLKGTMQVNMSVSDAVYDALAGMAAADRTYGESIQQWIENELIPVVSDMRARNEVEPGEKVRIVFENDTFYVRSRRIDHPIKVRTFVREESIDDVLKELTNLTGLASVKSFVNELMETVKLNKRRALEGGGAVSMALHMVFTGNPGTGKTTVARLIARILKAMGLLAQGQLVETARQDLVGQYVGSTAPKTMAKIEEALGGVLFIDEAYALARHDHDTFGLEAIDTIVKAMEDHRGNLVVVLAGYTQEMEDFLRTNPGLRSRFPFIVEFPDYTPADMLDILQRMAKSSGFRIEPGAYDGLTELFAQRQIPGRNDSGNGRLVRNLFEEAVRKQATRLGGQAPGAETDMQLLTGADFGIGERKAFDIESELAAIVGLDKVKAFVRTLEKQLIVDRRRKEAGVQVDTGQTINMIFSGNPGTGKTTMARLLAGMLKSMGYLKKGHLVEVDRSNLVAEYVGQTAVKTKQVVDSALGGVLFIDEAYALAEEGVQGGGFGKEAIDTLVRLIEMHKNNLVVILAGYTDEMTRFVRVNPGMSSRFPLQIEFPDYTAAEMERIAGIMVKGRGFSWADDVPVPLRAYFERKQIPGKKDGGNGRLVRNVLEEAIRRQAERLADGPQVPVERLNELTLADFGLDADREAAGQAANALSELDAVVGLSSVKEFVRSLSAQIEVAARRKEMGLPAASAQTLHMVFKGNPGTGKTTIARILARRLKELGAIKADTLVETDRSGLVAGYVGQTALKTRDVIERALGGVLFVDEAYALAEGDQFGQEAIDTLVKAMDDYRDRLVVVLAGYDQDMERFLDRNAGLRSRFPNIITFPDYTADEMLQIAGRILGAQGYRMTERTEVRFIEAVGPYVGELSAGNGRLVRNMCEKAIRSHALRVSGKADATEDDLSTLLPEDFAG
ncbi:AAA family ATPase [Paenibacillus ginsengarvi]|uniref:AAA family ATPase n=1 Tax=Paenibacillus ginsengarvi TaxID=400777 RepID=A0A3B0CFR3_9BACL|nr:AAA family ATPase [Paenibacillus ginsengarvi]RKN83911.1 AAA family ATPase [Paenibacillus ginsengarvi]